MIYATLMLLAAGKFLTNTLTPEDVGHFALLLICAECLGMFANLGLPATAPKLLQSRGPEDRARLLANLFTLQLAVALALAAVCAVAAFSSRTWLPHVGSWLPLPPRLFTILPVLLVATAFRDFLLAGAAGLHDYRRRAGAIAVMSTLQAVTFGALFLGEAGSPLSFAASQLFAVAAGATLLSSAVERTGRTDWRDAIACARFSLPLFANNVLNFIYQRADTLLVVYFLGIEAAAFYEMAKRIPGVLSRFFVAVLIPYLPSISELLRRGERGSAARMLEQVSVYSAFTGYGMTLCAVAVQGPLLHVLFTEDYAGAAPVVGPLLIAACLSVQAGVMGQALIALERPHWVMIVNVGLAAIGLGLNLLLLPRFGLAGAGWSAAAAALFSYVLQFAAVRKCGIRVAAGPALLVHGSFAVAYTASVLSGNAPLVTAAAALGFGLACVLLRTVSLRELVAAYRPRL